MAVAMEYENCHCIQQSTNLEGCWHTDWTADSRIFIHSIGVVLVPYIILEFLIFTEHVLRLLYGRSDVVLVCDETSIDEQKRKCCRSEIYTTAKS